MQKNGKKSIVTILMLLDYTVNILLYLPGSLSSGVKGSGLLWWPGRQVASPWQVSLTLEAHPLVPGSGQGLQLSVLHSRTSALLGSRWAEAQGT